MLNKALPSFFRVFIPNFMKFVSNLCIHPNSKIVVHHIFFFKNVITSKIKRVSKNSRFPKKKLTIL